MSRGAGKINALVPYFGGKRTLASEIIRQLGHHRAYWEPFCGSMAVLLAKKPVSSETVNDLYGDLINLARVLQDPATRAPLHEMVRWTLFHEGLHADARAMLEMPLGADGPNVLRAYWFLVASWFGRNGTTGTEQTSETFCVRYTASGGQPSVRWMGVEKSIRRWGRRLQRVTISQRNAFELLEPGGIEDAAGVVIYCDPPYRVKRARYIHDFKASTQGGLLFGDEGGGSGGGGDDHERLARALGRFEKTRVVVSYYPDPEIDRLYRDWTRVEIDVSKATAHAGQRGKKDARATEVLFINGPEIKVSAYDYIGQPEESEEAMA